MFESRKDRGNLIARTTGEGTGPSLLLLSHLDVVPADPSRWKHPPFSGLVEDGYVWGRGAIDMKSMTAVEAKVFAELASESKSPKGDLILAATADDRSPTQLYMSP